MQEDHYDPLAPEVLEDPFPTYAQMRARCPVQHVTVNDTSYYVLFRHHDVRRAQIQVTHFNSSTGPSPLFRARGGLFDDGPAHRATRNLVIHRLSEASLSRYEARIAAIAEQLIDSMIARGSSAELHDDFAVPLPIKTISLLLGIGDTNYLQLKTVVDSIIEAGWSVKPVDYARHFAEAAAFLDPYLDRYEALLTAAGVAQPGREHVGTVLPDDFIADVICGQVQGRYISRQEQHNLLVALVIGGSETTTFAITSALWRLLEEPTRWSLLTSDPDRWIPTTVEETLRHDPPNLGLWRTTACPVELHGVAIPQNAKVQMSYASANRDESIFTDPDNFDMTRPHEQLSRHMSFGVGTHTCLGQNLARMEIRLALKLLATRLPGMSLAGPTERVGNYAFWGRSRLPIHW